MHNINNRHVLRKFIISAQSTSLTESLAFEDITILLFFTKCVWQNGNTREQHPLSGSDGHTTNYVRCSVVDILDGCTVVVRKKGKNGWPKFFRNIGETHSVFYCQLFWWLNSSDNPGELQNFGCSCPWLVWRSTQFSHSDTTMQVLQDNSNVVLGNQHNHRQKTLLPAFIILHTAGHQPMAAPHVIIANAPEYATCCHCVLRKQTLWHNLGNTLEIYDYLL